MRSIQIGTRKVAQLGQGTWDMGDSPTKRVAEVAALRRGLELGLSVIDTAEMYGDGRSELLVGEAIVGRRDQTYLVSKVLPSNASAHGTVRACEASLERLRVETLDLYLLHWPGRFPLEETAEGFDRLLDQGKIQAWGVSNFDVSGMREVRSLQSGISCIADQVLYNPEYRGIEFDLLPWCEEHQTTVMAYSPVGQGGGLLRSAALSRVARRRAVSPAQIALAWGMRQPILSIPKAGTVQHVEENLAATLLELTSEDLEDIDREFTPPNKSRRLLPYNNKATRSASVAIASWTFGWRCVRTQDSTLLLRVSVTFRA